MGMGGLGLGGVSGGVAPGLIVGAGAKIGQHNHLARLRHFAALTLPATPLIQALIRPSGFGVPAFVGAWVNWGRPNNLGIGKKCRIVAIGRKIDISEAQARLVAANGSVKVAMGERSESERVR